MRHIIFITIITVITVIAFSNIFQNDFVIDDHAFIKEWEMPKSIANIPAIFAGETAPIGHELVYRPIRGVFYTLAYQLFGENPFGYHVLSLLVHLSATVLVYLITASLLGRLGRFGGLGAFATTLLFTLHPTKVEAITYITASFDIIGVVFFFASFYFYLRGIGGSRGIRDKALSVFFALLAFFTYEMTLTLPLLIFLHHVILSPAKRGEGSPLRFFAEFTLTLWNVLRMTVPYAGAAFLFLFIRIVLLGITARGEYLQSSFFITQLTMVKAWIKYLWLLVFPARLSINQEVATGIRSWVHPLASMNTIISQSIFDPAILFSITVITVLIVIMIIARKREPLITFSIGWFFITLLPVSYLIPQGPIMQERYLYIPSFGFVLLMAYLFYHLFLFVEKKTQNSKLKTQNYKSKLKSAKTFNFLPVLLPFAFLLLPFFYGYRTYTRNADWKDGLAVWSALAKDYPNDVLSNYYTALEHKRRGNVDDAIEYLNKTLTIQPRLHEAYFQLGEIAASEGSTEAAKMHYERALEIYPGFAPAKERLEDVTLGRKRSKEGWSEHLTKYGFSFTYPVKWKLTKIDKGARLVSDDGSFAVELKLLIKDFDGNMQQFLASQGQALRSYGVLVKQGQAQIPDVVESYVRIWNDPSVSSGQVRGVQKMQFFLLKDNKVVQALVGPVDSPLMKEFDRILGTVKMDIRQTVR